LDDAGLETCRKPAGSHPASYSVGTGFISWSESGLHLEPVLRMSARIPLRLICLNGVNRNNFTFYLSRDVKVAWEDSIWMPLVSSLKASTCLSLGHRLPFHALFCSYVMLSAKYGQVNKGQRKQAVDRLFVGTCTQNILGSGIVYSVSQLDYGLDARKFVVRFSVRTRNTSLLQSVHISSGAYPAFY
jgi:hypothetical protein